MAWSAGRWLLGAFGAPGQLDLHKAYQARGLQAQNSMCRGMMAVRLLLPMFLSLELAQGS